jgi:hypothetical protein
LREEERHSGDAGNGLAQELQMLAEDVVWADSETRDVAPRLVQARSETSESDQR